MSYFMLFQITGSMKLLSTLKTLVSRSTVKLHVSVQLLFCFEESSFRTDGTFVFSFLMWVASCLFKLDFLENFIPQVEHTNGFSPVWTLEWTSRLYLLAKAFKQILHLFGLNSSCFILLWQLSPVWLKNVFSQIWQLNFFPIFFCTISQSANYN